MADPATMTMASMGMNIAGGGLKVFGSLFGGDAKSDEMKYKAAVARAQAEVAKRNAQDSLTTGGVEARRMGQKVAQKVGAMKVIQSGRGIDINSGSASQVREDQRAAGYEDQQTIRSNAHRRAYAYEVDAAMKTADASMYERGAEQSKLASYIEAGSSILGSATSVASKWSEASQMGIFGGGSDAYVDNRTSDDYYYG